MSTNGLGQTFRSNTLNWILRGATVPGRVATYYISLHSADPGEDGGAGANEVSGNAYARQTITSSTGWTTPSAATPYAISNAAVITFPTATPSAWASGAALTYFGVWTSLSGTATTDFVGRGPLQGAGVIVLSGQTASFAIGAISLSITTVTSGSTTGMGQTFRKNLVDYLICSGTAGGTDPLSGITINYVSLHTADPGVDGQTANEPVGNAYARSAAARNTTIWGAGTVATPSVITNSVAVVTFPQATGSWGTLTFFSVWNNITGVATTNFLLKGTITSISVTNGNIPSFATSTLTTRLDAT